MRPSEPSTWDGARHNTAAGERTSEDPSLSTLTGVRSGKKSYYVELRRTEERMTSAVRALEGISSSLVRTRDNPLGLLHGVLRAAAGHLRADWTMVALRQSAFPQLGVRFVAAGRTGALIDSERALPASLREQLYEVRADHDPGTAVRGGWVRVPMTLDGEVLGRLVVAYQPGDTVDPEDLWVLRILANQAAMSIQTAMLFAAATEQREHAQHLLDEIARSSETLESRTAELQRAEGRLQVLHQRELLDAERHRIALELHDSVAQYVLSAGLAVDVCRAEAVEREGPGGGSVTRLVHARDLVAMAGDQVRSVIYALHHQPVGDEVASLSDLLHGLAAQHRPTLGVTVRIEGVPVPLGAKIEHAVARIAGEALFNVSIHANATRAAVRLRYTDDGARLWVSDDGVGDPRDLRRRLRVSIGGTPDGRHQGLINMARRAEDLGGTFAIRRARTGGIRIEVSVPPSRTHRLMSDVSGANGANGANGERPLIDLVLVDDHAVVRQGLRSVLERESDLRVVGEAATPEAAMDVVAATNPSLVLLDLKLSGAPGLAGLDLCEALVGAHPGLSVLVLTTTLDDSIVAAALRRGARGYVVKEVDTSELVRAIRTVNSGQNAFDPKSASAMVRGLSAGKKDGARSLTSRELEVLRLLARGMSNGEIGKALFISQTTAKFHVANIMRKLEVGHRAEAVYVASKMGAL